MNFLKTTFQSQWSLFIYLFIFALLNSIENIIDFYRNESRIGITESIGSYELYILIFAFVILLPIQLLLSIIALIKYPGSVPLMCWNSKRPFWCWFWTLIFTALMYYPSASLSYSFTHKDLLYHPELILFFFITLHYVMYLRASLVMSDLFYKTK